jgi:hypothetical protein
MLNTSFKYSHGRRVFMVLKVLISHAGGLDEGDLLFFSFFRELKSGLQFRDGF